MSSGREEQEEEGRGSWGSRYWQINALRSTVLICGVLGALLVVEKLDLFIAVCGAILGMTNVLLFPTIAHLQLISVTLREKRVDKAIICFALFMIVFGPVTILTQHRKNELESNNTLL